MRCEVDHNFWWPWI